MSNPLTRCLKSITNGHDGNTIDGDVDDAFVIDFVVVNVVYNAHDVATIVLSFGVTTSFSKAIIIPSSGCVFVAYGFMDQQKTTSTFTSMDQENSMVHVLYIYIFTCMF
jgi:hypothetical protein